MKFLVLFSLLVVLVAVFGQTSQPVSNHTGHHHRGHGGRFGHKSFGHRGDGSDEQRIREHHRHRGRNATTSATPVFTTTI
uniref:Uncharacterized protein n=1 Tax=Acrobeloides nanus TaxID=290746 RepID=A0A914ECL3_9BILA